MRSASAVLNNAAETADDIRNGASFHVGGTRSSITGGYLREGRNLLGLVADKLDARATKAAPAVQDIQAKLTEIRANVNDKINQTIGNNSQRIIEISQAAEDNKIENAKDIQEPEINLNN